MDLSINGIYFLTAKCINIATNCKMVHTKWKNSLRTLWLVQMKRRNYSLHLSEQENSQVEY